MYTDNNIPDIKNLSISQDDIKGLKIMLNVGAQLANRRLQELSRIEGQSKHPAMPKSVNCEEFERFTYGHKLAKNFLEFLSKH